MKANRREMLGEELTRTDILDAAAQKWPTGQHIITVDQIQRQVEKYYDVAHDDLIGSKRNKELMEARHVGIWLTRELTDNTLAEIGKKFGGRTHATVKHSIAWVDDFRKRDRIFHDRIETLRDQIADAT
jgi:chromosomal replication initiator protein